MNLSIDIGNTRTKLGFFEGDELVNHFAFLKMQFNEAIQAVEKKLPLNKLIISSVSYTENGFIDFINGLGIPVIHLDHNTPVPVKNFYKTPQTLGKDRLAAVIGANSIYPGSDVLIINAGTAITYDFVSAEGEYNGGNISPGLEMRFRALNEYTDRLPKVAGNDKFSETGYDTESSLVSGVQWGIIYEMEGYIGYYTSRYRDLKIILSGGDANFFVKKLKNPIFVVPNLVLIGLNHILRYNENFL